MADRKQELKRYYGHPLFNVILEEMKELHSVKNRQYATEDNPLGNFERTGRMMKEVLKEGVPEALVSALWLASKQIDGAIQIIAHGKTNTPDTLEEKLRDAANYFIIAMIINRELQQKAG
jgi:hypothetical protein